MAGEGDEEMVTLKEAMNLLKVSRTTIYRLIAAEKLTPIDSSAALDKPRILFKRSQVLGLLRQQ